MDDREKIFTGGGSESLPPPPPPPHAGVAMSEEQFGRLIAAIGHAGRGTNEFDAARREEQRRVAEQFRQGLVSRGRAPLTAGADQQVPGRAYRVIRRERLTLHFDGLPAGAKRVRVFLRSGVAEGPVDENEFTGTPKGTSSFEGGIARVEFVDERGSVLAEALIPDAMRPQPLKGRN